MTRIHFGTDGWRAVISEDFTFDNVKIVVQSIADYIKSIRSQVTSRRSQIYGKKIKVVVGYDTRFLSEKYAELAACVFAANGIKAVLTDRPTPTPSVSFYIRRRNLIGGVMITASHNPGRYNGIKYKDYFGGSAGEDVTNKLESGLYKSKVKFMDKDKAEKKGLLKEENIIPIHLSHIKKYANFKLLKNSNLSVLVDSMNGTGDSFIEEVLKDTNNKVKTINSNRDPYFGGRSPEPNEMFLKDASSMMRKGRYDIGLVTDGDADRLGVICSDGKVISGHKIMTLLLLHFIEDRSLKGSVVQTICGTALIDKICKFYGLKTYETKVGFKYIAEIFNKENVLLGGEETGGVAFRGWLPERDGILSGLLILEMMAHRKKGLSDILKKIDKDYGIYIYKRHDLYFSQNKRKRLLEILRRRPFAKILGRTIKEIKSYDGFKYIREDGSWLMLRPSGTEPKLRIYSEAHSEKDAVGLIKFGRKFAIGV